MNGQPEVLYLMDEADLRSMMMQSAGLTRHFQASGILLKLTAAFLLILSLLNILSIDLTAAASRLSPLSDCDAAGLEILLDQIPAADAAEIRKLIDQAPKAYREQFLRHCTGFSICETQGRQYYDAESKTVYVNFAKAATDERGAYETFFHECAHAIDDLNSGRFHESLSMSGNFRGNTLKNALTEDYEDLLQRLTGEISTDSQNTKPCGDISEFSQFPGPENEPGENGIRLYDEELQEKLRPFLCGPAQACISDILGGLSGNRLRAREVSENRISYGYGHETQYWEVKGNLEREFFAEYFSYRMTGNKEAVSEISDPERGIFPKAAAWIDSSV